MLKLLCFKVLLTFPLVLIQIPVSHGTYQRWQNFLCFPGYYLSRYIGTLLSPNHLDTQNVGHLFCAPASVLDENNYYYFGLNVTSVVTPNPHTHTIFLFFIFFQWECCKCFDKAISITGHNVFLKGLSLSCQPPVVLGNCSTAPFN